MCTNITCPIKFKIFEKLLNFVLNSKKYFFWIATFCKALIWILSSKIRICSSSEGTFWILDYHLNKWLKMIARYSIFIFIFYILISYFCLFSTYYCTSALRWIWISVVFLSIIILLYRKIIRSVGLWRQWPPFASESSPLSLCRDTYNCKIL